MPLPRALVVAAVAAHLLSIASSQDRPATEAPPQARAFERFRARVKVRWDKVWLHIESDGMPDHAMMTGIRAWQQQVPLPQPYTGDNDWRIPLQPTVAATPKSTKTGFFRGAIAIAVNGVPIFNPIKNDGRTDTLLAGELDGFGGHAGRADDYHYHIAPVFLNDGDPSRPVAYALDGYAIYGYDEPDGSPCRALDACNGHDDAKYGYHYHATKTYPYLNGGFHGEVRDEDGQVEPQPHAHPVRPATEPLRGAVIRDFEKSTDGKTYTLQYEQRGKTGSVQYTQRDDGSVHFVFRLPDGSTGEETYRPSSPRGGGGSGGGAGRGQERGGRRPEAPQDPAPADERLPWLAAHLDEIDGDADGVITTAELDTECLRTTAGFDADRDGRIDAAERDAPGAGRSAMGGFVKQHWSEVDADGDGVVTGAEITANAKRMFERADRDRDGRLTRDEAKTRGGGGRGQGGQGNGGQGNGGRGQGGQGQGGGRRGYPVLGGFQTDVPAHTHDVVLASPTATSIVVSLWAYAAGAAFVEYGLAAGGPRQRTQPVATTPDAPVAIALTGLRADTAYSYRVHTRSGDAREFTAGTHATFHTQRGPQSAFTFTVQADSHLDGGVVPAVYERTLANARADRPDFHVDLGDTFMVDKREAFRDAAPQYRAQRYYFGQLCDSAPLFLVLGNHDGEYGYGGRGPDEISGWSFAQRTAAFPSPRLGEPGSIYSGRTDWQDRGGAHHYAFEWGPALCCVLDPFWPTEQRRRGGGSEVELSDNNWVMTLGRAQYDGLTQRLAASKAPWKFVFVHHLVGGRGKATRGGVEAAPYFEWGGRNADGSEGFAKQRPGWPEPIHRLLVRHGVAVVFHGHDHLYVRHELDGVVYQCVPQPGNPRGGTRSAEAYGYTGGTILGSPGHLRVQVANDRTTVALVRAGLGDQSDNGTAAHEYTLTREARR